jgi:hypothetical protein
LLGACQSNQLAIERIKAEWAAGPATHEMKESNSKKQLGNGSDKLLVETRKAAARYKREEAEAHFLENQLAIERIKAEWAAEPATHEMKETNSETPCLAKQQQQARIKQGDKQHSAKKMKDATARWN